MNLISHRGNINGKQLEYENDPKYIINALREGYDVEIDVWYKNKNLYLGHDEPQYKTDLFFLDNKKFWLHSKNDDAFFILKNKIKKADVFWHDKDDFTLTKNGFIWTYPNKKLFQNSICVLPEMGYNGNLKKCYGICSDIIKYFSK